MLLGYAPGVCWGSLRIIYGGLVFVPKPIEKYAQSYILGPSLPLADMGHGIVMSKILQRIVSIQTEDLLTQHGSPMFQVIGKVFWRGVKMGCLLKKGFKKVIGTMN